RNCHHRALTSVPDYLELHRKGQMIQEASRIVKANNEVNYEGKVNGKDLIFGADGDFIRENKEAND
ncbi:MAG TPA: hypothetical protein VNR87_07915, partial [Flavisolibacter sp.]|nr:hypothetical protein [Flavisolibacter sp.]